MKLINALCYACLFIFLTAARCNKEKDPVNQLPPETQEGKGTFGCLINGQLFTPGNNGSFTPILSCYYQHIYPTPSGFVFNISAIDKRTSFLRLVAINVDSMQIQEGASLILGGSNSRAGAQCVNGNVLSEFTYYTIKGYKGILYFNKVDESAQIISGTFWFDAINSFGDTIKISEGRFDVKYTR